jgi:hypothetical protein
VFFTWQSGTPVNEFGSAGRASFFGLANPVFLVPRGSVGRTPAIWDLNLRLTYEARSGRTPRWRVVLDLLHLGNPRAAVRLDEQRFLALDPPDGLLSDPPTGTQTSENPNYLQPVAFQPPMTARLGIEISF